MNQAANVMSEFLFSTDLPCSSAIHLENPVRKSWSHILTTFASRLGLSSASSERVSFSDWLKLVENYGRPEENPCVKIVPFLEEEFLRMATGQVVLDTTMATTISKTLADSKEAEEETLIKYVDYWKEQRFV